MANTYTSTNITANWSRTTTWSPGTVPGSSSNASDTDAVVLSDTNASASYTVNFNETTANWYIGTLTLNASGSGTETLAFNTNSSQFNANGAITLGTNTAITLLGTDITSTTSSSGISNSGTISGYGTITVNSGGGITGTGAIIANGGTLDLVSTVASGSVFTIATANASDLKFDSTATAAAAISINNANQKLEIGASGALTINAAESITNGTIRLDGGSLTDSSGLTIGSGGTLIGSGTVNSTLNASTGTVRASGGVLDLVSNVATSSGLIFNIGTTTGSVLEFGGSVGSGNTVTFVSGNANPTALELTNLGGFSGTVSGLEIESGGATTVAGENYINVQGSTITTVTVGNGSTGNQFTGVNASATTINIYNGASLLDTISLASAPTSGTFVDWGAATGITGSTINSGTDIFLDNAVCFATGTRIRTVDGDAAVEDLAAGDTVMTLSGTELVARPVQWIGTRRIDLTRHPRPNLAAPVRIRRDAFGDNLPQRDLVVSPDHCLFVDGGLIPAKLLINDMTIVQERNARAVTYYHVELDRHAILLAEGLPAESYLDTGNRAFFSNAGMALVLHPEFTVNAGLKRWETDACAPLTVAQELVKPIWHRLAQRAESFGYRRPDQATIDDPGLSLIADGRTIRPISNDAGRYIFMLPAGASSLRLASRTGVPSYWEAYLDDWRQLGVAVRRITVRDSAGLTEIPPDHPGLTGGWHAVERDAVTMWRWTDGDAVLPIPPRDGPAVVEVQVGATMRYAIVETAEIRRLAA